MRYFNSLSDVFASATEFLTAHCHCALPTGGWEMDENGDLSPEYEPGSYPIFYILLKEDIKVEEIIIPAGDIVYKDDDKVSAAAAEKFWNEYEEEPVPVY